MAKHSVTQAPSNVIPFPFERCNGPYADPLAQFYALEAEIDSSLRRLWPEHYGAPPAGAADDPLTVRRAKSPGIANDPLTQIQRSARADALELKALIDGNKRPQPSASDTLTEIQLSAREAVARLRALRVPGAARNDD